MNSEKSSAKSHQNDKMKKKSNHGKVTDSIIEINSNYEFSRPIQIDQIGTQTLIKEITATESEAAALAKRFDLIAIEKLSAKITISLKSAGQIIEAKGRLTAKCQQKCVVTLAAVPATINEEFNCHYVLQNPSDEPSTDSPSNRQINHANGGELELFFDNEDSESLQGNCIDLGELVAQYFFLALDPYPRLTNAQTIANDQ